jgi:rubrerythrin
MGVRLKVGPDVTQVSVGGVNYKATRGVVEVNEAHEGELRRWHGLMSPEEHEARERAQARAAAARAAAAARQAEQEHQARLDAAKQLLEQNGLSVLPGAKK